MMLFDVPADVLCQEVFSYLSLSDLRSLNIAYTNKHYRPQLNRIWSIYKKPRYISIHKKVLHLKCIGIDVVEICFMNIDGSGRIDIEESTLWSIVHKISAGCPKLRVLHVDRNDPLTHEMAMQLSRRCPQLEDLSLSADGFSDALITEFAQHCHRLHTLSLSSNLITDVSIHSICNNCPDLRSIRIFCCNLTDASLIAIANTYPHLQSINMTYCKFTDDAVICFANKCHELRSVSVSGDNVTSRGLAALWAANPNITKVSVPESVSDDDIILLAKSCAQLEYLSVRSCKCVSDASLTAIGRHCHELTTIDISYTRCITDVGVAALAAGCPLLETFFASDAHITDNSLTALSSCPKLQRVVIGNTGVTANGVSMFKKQSPNCVLFKI